MPFARFNSAAAIHSNLARPRGGQCCRGGQEICVVLRGGQSPPPWAQLHWAARESFPLSQRPGRSSHLRLNTTGSRKATGPHLLPTPIRRHPVTATTTRRPGSCSFRHHSFMGDPTTVEALVMGSGGTG